MKRACFLFFGLCFSTFADTQPAAADLAPPGAIVLSEVCYNPPASLGADERFEWVEIHNRSREAVEVSSWRLKDRALAVVP